jgi:hypothetical protein
MANTSRHQQPSRPEESEKKFDASYDRVLICNALINN